MYVQLCWNRWAPPPVWERRCLNNNHQTNIMSYHHYHHADLLCSTWHCLHTLSWLITWLILQMTNLSLDRESKWVSDYSNDYLIGWLNDWSIEWVYEWVSEWVSEWVTGWTVGRLVACLVGGMGKQIHWHLMGSIVSVLYAGGTEARLFDMYSDSLFCHLVHLLNPDYLWEY